MRRIAPRPVARPAASNRFHPSELANRVRGLSPLARIEGVTLRVRTTDPHDESQFDDRDRVLQLTTSLVSLAVRYSRNGKVNLRVDRATDGALRLFLTFSDIGAADRDHQLLWSGDRAPGRTLQSVIRDFVFDLGAEVGIAAGLHDQTELCITLPKASGERPVGELSGLHILLIGEARDTLETASALLVSRGARVTTLGQGGASALGRFDAVIVDVDAVENEVETLFKLRDAAHMRGQRQVPALALVGTAAREDIERLFCVGFGAMTFKPLHIDEICRKLQDVI